MTADLGGACILLVEDEVLIACDIAIAIEDAGGVVVGPASSLGRALSLIETSLPTAAILDVRLGSDDVGSAARLLTQKGVPFVFHTGHADSEVLAEWSDVPILRKPVPPARLIEAVQRLLRHRLSR